MKISKKDLETFYKIDKQIANLPEDIYITKVDNEIFDLPFAVYIDRNDNVVALCIDYCVEVINECFNIDQYELEKVIDFLKIHHHTLSDYYYKEIDEEKVLQAISIKRPFQRSNKVLSWCEFLDDDVYYIYTKALDKLNFKQSCEIYIDLFNENICKCILWSNEKKAVSNWSWNIWEYLRFVIQKAIKEFKQEEIASKISKYFLNKIFDDEHDIYSDLAYVSSIMKTYWHEDYNRFGEVIVNEETETSPYNYNMICKKYIEFKEKIKEYLTKEFKDENKREFRRFVTGFWRK